MSARPLPPLLTGSGVQVGVHIADVSHFIRPGTAIDKEAANRGTTVYLIDRRIDMVPGTLYHRLPDRQANRHDASRQIRYTTVYLTDRRIEMMPSTLYMVTFFMLISHTYITNRDHRVINKVQRTMKIEGGCMHKNRIKLHLIAHLNNKLCTLQFLLTSELA